MAFSVSDIVRWSGGRLVNGTALGEACDRIRVERPSPLGVAKPDHLAFFFSQAFKDELATASPGILVTGDAFVAALEAGKLPLWSRAAVVACRDPYYAMALLSEKFAVVLSSVAHVETPQGKTEIHPTAVVHPKAEIGKGARIGPYCVVEEEARIGAGTLLYAGCHIGPGCVIGEDCVLFPHVTLYEWTQVGNRVRLHAGCVLGADGFGYAPRFEQGRPVDQQKIFHLGRVVIGDDVEIGANSAIDRSTFGETRVETRAKIDDLVHVGHNCTIEEGAILCGGSGFAGGVRIGKFAYIGGMCGIANNVYVGDGSKVGACSLISKDVPPGTTALGNPQREHSEHFRAHALLTRLMAERRKK